MEELHNVRAGMARKYAVAGAAVTGASLVVAPSAFGAASTTTGIDYTADLISPIKSELTLAIVAGLALMVVLMAVRAGTRLVKSFGR